jgi:hypothetical protein
VLKNEYLTKKNVKLDNANRRTDLALKQSIFETREKEKTITSQR